jgi:hypothetical protein
MLIGAGLAGESDVAVAPPWIELPPEHIVLPPAIDRLGFGEFAATDSAAHKGSP